MFIYTKPELELIKQTRLHELIDYAGDMTHLGFMLDIPITTIERWKESGHISKRFAVEIDEHPVLGRVFKAFYLRPDLYLKARIPCVHKYIKDKKGFIEYAPEELNYMAQLGLKPEDIKIGKTINNLVVDGKKIEVKFQKLPDISTENVSMVS